MMRRAFCCFLLPSAASSRLSYLVLCENLIIGSPARPGKPAEVLLVAL